MSLGDLTDPAAVHAAMNEFDRVGRETFLRSHGFRERRQYVVDRAGVLYDAKALAGVAHGYQHPELGVLPAARFNGGEVGANAALRRLGFEVRDLEQWQLEDERHWRDGVWARLQEQGSGDVDPQLLRTLGVYGGAQGVWVDKQRTRALRPSGVAVAVLHTGEHYDDDLGQDGLIYHYPRTRRPVVRDQNEVLALREAEALQLPVFVITHAGSGQRRAVRRGWVQSHDDDVRVAYISFEEHQGSAELTLAADSDSEFQLIADSPRHMRSALGRRGNQPRFKYNALRYYGGRCLLSGVSVPEMLEAAHCCPDSMGGTDDHRNGLLINAALHRAFDRQLWAIHPDTLQVVVRPQGPTAAEMGIAHTDLSGQPALPHPDALRYRYRLFVQHNNLSERDVAPVGPMKASSSGFAPSDSPGSRRSGWAGSSNWR